jgi:hypothetical protein
MRLGWAIILLFTVAVVSVSTLGNLACTGCSSADGGSCGITEIPDACPTCLPDGGQTRFTIYTIDPTTFEVQGFAPIPTFQMALTPSGGLGFAYVEQSADQTTGKPRPDPQIINYEIRYAEWNGGTVASQQLIHFPVQNFVGVSLDYQPAGEPAVAYLGWVGGPDAGFDASQAFWYQNNAVVNYRSGGATWTEQTAVQTSGDAVSDPAVASTADQGMVVGLFPALLFDGSNGAILAYKDVHNGSSAGLGDYASADLELALGGPTAWTHYVLQVGKDATPIVNCSSTSARLARGSHTKLIHGAGQKPVLVADIGGNAPPATDIARDVYFTERAAAPWAPCPVSLILAADSTILPNGLTNTQTGPSVAYEPVEGYGVAVTSVSDHGVFYKSCKANCNTPSNWSVFQTVFQFGSGGYFASVAINPDSHEPWVAHYYCSGDSSKNVNSCPPSENELRVSSSTRFGGVPGPWVDEPVDVNGGFQTQSLFLKNPTRLAIAYRDPNTGVLKLAVEKVP